MRPGFWATTRVHCHSERTNLVFRPTVANRESSHNFYCRCILSGIQGQAPETEHPEHLQCSRTTFQVSQKLDPVRRTFLPRQRGVIWERVRSAALFFGGLLTVYGDHAVPVFTEDWSSTHIQKNSSRNDTSRTENWTLASKTRPRSFLDMGEGKLTPGSACMTKECS